MLRFSVPVALALVAGVVALPVEPAHGHAVLSENDHAKEAGHKKATSMKLSTLFQFFQADLAARLSQDARTTWHGARAHKAHANSTTVRSAQSDMVDAGVKAFISTTPIQQAIDAAISAAGNFIRQQTGGTGNIHADLDMSLASDVTDIGDHWYLPFSNINFDVTLSELEVTFYNLDKPFDLDLIVLGEDYLSIRFSHLDMKVNKFTASCAEWSEGRDATGLSICNALRWMPMLWSGGITGHIDNLNQIVLQVPLKFSGDTITVVAEPKPFATMMLDGLHVDSFLTMGETASTAYENRIMAGVNDVMVDLMKALDFNAMLAPLKSLTVPFMEKTLNLALQAVGVQVKSDGSAFLTASLGPNAAVVDIDVYHAEPSPNEAASLFTVLLAKKTIIDMGIPLVSYMSLSPGLVGGLIEPILKGFLPEYLGNVLTVGSTDPPGARSFSDPSGYLNIGLGAMQGMGTRTVTKICMSKVEPASGSYEGVGVSDSEFYVSTYVPPSLTTSAIHQDTQIVSVENGASVNFEADYGDCVILSGVRETYSTPGANVFFQLWEDDPTQDDYEGEYKYTIDWDSIGSAGTQRNAFGMAYKEAIGSMSPSGSTIYIRVYNTDMPSAPDPVQSATGSLTLCAMKSTDTGAREALSEQFYAKIKMSGYPTCQTTTVDVDGDPTWCSGDCVGNLGLQGTVCCTFDGVATGTDATVEVWEDDGDSGDDHAGTVTIPVPSRYTASVDGTTEFEDNKGDVHYNVGSGTLTWQAIFAPPPPPPLQGMVWLCARQSDYPGETESGSEDYYARISMPGHATCESSDYTCNGCHHPNWCGGGSCLAAPQSQSSCCAFQNVRSYQDMVIQVYERDKGDDDFAGQVTVQVPSSHGDTVEVTQPFEDGRGEDGKGAVVWDLRFTSSPPPSPPPPSPPPGSAPFTVCVRSVDARIKESGKETYYCRISFPGKTTCETNYVTTDNKPSFCSGSCLENPTQQACCTFDNVQRGSTSQAQIDFYEDDGSSGDDHGGYIKVAVPSTMQTRVTQQAKTLQNKDISEGTGSVTFEYQFGYY